MTLGFTKTRKRNHENLFEKTVEAQCGEGKRAIKKQFTLRPTFLIYTQLM